MNDFLGQLNLTVQERRIVMGIFAVVILVLNYLFVWPRFGEWSRMNKQLIDMRDTMKTYNRFILQDTDPTNGFRKLVAKYARLEGGDVTEHTVVDPQVQLMETIRRQASKTGVNVESYNTGSVKTNAFFEEHSTVISIESQEPQLINFLFNMGNDPAMIRVGKLDLKPADQNRYRLRGGITLTANYAKQPAAAVTSSGPTKPGAPRSPGKVKDSVTSAKPGTPGSKPAAAGAKPAAAGAKPSPGAPPSPGGRKMPPSAGAGPGAGRMPIPAPGPNAVRRPVPTGPPAPSP
jgi:hypothetical protein